MRAVNVRSSPAFGEGLRIDPGRKETSTLWQVLKAADLNMKMPPLATKKVDPLAVDLLGRWIDSGD